MKQYSILQRIYMSFFSPSLYQDVRKYWNGKAFIHLLVITAIFTIPLMVQLQISIYGFMTSNAQKIMAQVPELTIKNGQLTTPEAKKYLINDPENGTTLINIDVTDTSNTAESGTYALLAKDKLIIQYNTRSVTLPLIWIKDLTLNQTTMEQWSELTKIGLALVIYPFAVLGIFILRAIEAVLFGLTGLLITMIIRSKFSHTALTRLSVIAMTPAIVLSTILGFSGIHHLYLPLLYTSLTLSYLVFGIMVSANNKDPIITKSKDQLAQKHTPAIVKVKKGMAVKHK